MGSVLGELLLREDSDRLRMSQDKGVTWTDPAGTSPANWFLEQFNFVKDKVPSVDWQMPFASECMGQGDINLAAAVGSGLFDNLQTRSGGWWRASSGVAGASNRVAYQKDGGGVGATAPSSVLVSNSRTKPWATGNRVVVVSLPGNTNAADDMLICNFLDGTNDNGIQLKGSTSQVNWCFNVGGSFTNTGVAVTTGAVYDLLTINDLSTVKGYVRNVTAGGSFAEIGSGASSALAVTAGVLRWFARANGATNHEFHMDKVMGMSALETA